MAEQAITLTPEDCRRLIVEAVEHAAMAGAYASLPAGLRVRILVAKDWLDSAPLPAEGPAVKPAPETQPTPQAEAPTAAKGGTKRKT